MVPSVPAPWQLSGNGYVLLYRFPKESASALVPPELSAHFGGGLGCLMLVDYLTSDAGPYRELLLIPGQFQFNGKRYYTITKIYVSTESSVYNGRINWAIPKELARFDIQPGADNTETFNLYQGDTLFFSATLKARGLHLPVNTTWLPLRPTLGQPQDKNLYLTAPTGSGSIQLASLEDLHINAAFFPDITAFRPLVAGKASNFRLTFPVADIKTLEQNP